MKCNIIKVMLIAGAMVMGQTNSYGIEDLKKATFAGGCFWCIEAAFEDMNGVADVVSGYAGGTGKDPDYDDYAEKGHIEVVQISYDPNKVSYMELLDIFWRQIDPTDPDGQFVDRGKQYSSAIFYHNDEQRLEAEISRKELDGSGRYKKTVITDIIELKEFYPAEDYHQNYHETHPLQYKVYRFNAGRDK
jgi:peptide methionine sulfoxide reductase msrA/msrB